MRGAWFILIPLVLGVSLAHAEDDFERPPIEYSRAAPNNAVTQLQTRLKRGETTLEFDDSHGYLPAVLKALRVPVESQMLVFSKTSMQRNRISPKTPRAIYFNDDVYVGYCHEGAVMEVSVADPALGAVFYTLDQESSPPSHHPVLVRKTSQCLQCHSTSLSGDVPSHLVRSVFTDAAGLPILSEGSFHVDHATPLEKRWGGWYVTGTHGQQTHLGNFIVREAPLPRPVRNPAGQNVTDLTPHFKTARYLTPHSDIVALMVFEHQTKMHNLMTRANFATRQALFYQAALNQALGDPVDKRLESTTRRIAAAGEDLVKGLLFVDEARLTAPLQGTSEFATQFMRSEPRDSQGRSLRDLDLKTRLFKYPCSYLIYCAAFDGLPREMKSYVAARLRQILTADNTLAVSAARQREHEDFANLSPRDRQVILEILKETKPDLLKL